MHSFSPERLCSDSDSRFSSISSDFMKCTVSVGVTVGRWGKQTGAPCQEGTIRFWCGTARIIARISFLFSRFEDNTRALKRNSFLSFTEKPRFCHEREDKLMHSLLGRELTFLRAWCFSLRSSWSSKAGSLLCQLARKEQAFSRLTGPYLKRSPTTWKHAADADRWKSPEDVNAALWGECHLGHPHASHNHAEWGLRGTVCK